jgi:hypothetical protein
MDMNLVYENRKTVLEMGKSGVLAIFFAEVRVQKRKNSVRNQFIHGYLGV